MPPGVYGYAMDGEQLVQRISPEPCVFYVRPGSYDAAAVEADAPDPTELSLITPRCRLCSRILVRV